MISISVYRCARPKWGLGVLCLALVVFCGFDISHSYATFIDFGSFFGSNSGGHSNSPSVELKVSDTAGPIDVDYDDLGTYEGLRTIKVQEKLFQPNGQTELNLWSDIEIQICIDLGDDYGHDNPFDDIFDHIDDIIDDIFGFLNHGSSHSYSSSHSSNYGYDHDDEEEEDDFENGLDILVKKYVKNKAHTLFSDYRMVLGTGVGDDFVASDPNDGLYFLATPAPTESTDYFQDPPLADGPNPDSLHWTSDGSNAPGLDHHDEARFKFGVHVPRSLFEESDDDCCEGLVARFTIRQHAEVPEPTALALMVLGIVTASVRRRRQPAGS